MSKILLLSGHHQLSPAALSWACLLQEQSPILLTGVFLPRDTYTDLLAQYALPQVAGLHAASAGAALCATEVDAPERFRQWCGRNGMEFRIHEVGAEALRAAIQTETRFADLLICDCSSLYEQADRLFLETYVGDILKQSECPVLLAPAAFTAPENVVMAYDGSADCVAAMKAFARTMPSLTRLDTLIVYLHADRDPDVPHRQYIEELAARHFTSLSFMKMPIDPQRHLDQWLHDQRKTLLVAGAYGRGALAQVFHRSFISDLLIDQQIALFIAHR